MVCLRCIKTVSHIAEDAGIKVNNVELGELTMEGTITAAQKETVSRLLKAEGFELLDDKNSRIVSQIKGLIIESIHFPDTAKPENMNFSTFLSKKTGHEYSSLSKLFSSVEGMTIEKYIIAQKIERIKELLTYEELSVSEIAWTLGYSSSQHLSHQFRNVTGMSPVEFRKDHRHDRKHIDHI